MQSFLSYITSKHDFIFYYIRFPKSHISKIKDKLVFICNTILAYLKNSSQEGPFLFILARNFSGPTFAGFSGYFVSPNKMNRSWFLRFCSQKIEIHTKLKSYSQFQAGLQGVKVIHIAEIVNWRYYCPCTKLQLQFYRPLTFNSRRDDDYEENHFAHKENLIQRKVNLANCHKTLNALLFKMGIGVAEEPLPEIESQLITKLSMNLSLLHKKFSKLMTAVGIQRGFFQLNEGIIVEEKKENTAEKGNMEIEIEIQN